MGEELIKRLGNKTMSHYESWIGLGVKGGGTLGVLGFETLEGEVCNLGYAKHSHEVNVSGIRYGIGLGGGAGFVAIVVFKCPNLKNLDETKTSDWSINIAIGEKWDGVVKGLKNRQFFTTMFRIGTKLINATPKDLDNIRNSMSYLWTAYDISGTSGPKLVTIDIPLMGIGAEVSAHFIDGEIRIGDLIREEGAY